jgi:hypothetical protein
MNPRMLGQFGGKGAGPRHRAGQTAYGLPANSRKKIAGTSPAIRVEPLKVAAESVQAAFLSRSAFHLPSEARPFICARWAKARCAAATFSLLPLHAFCGAACNARP